MKGFVLCLIAFASLANAAGVLTPPTPEKPNAKDDIIVHGDVVVGFEKDDNGKTIISVSPNDHARDDVNKDIDENAAGGYLTSAKEKLTQKLEEAKEKLKESTSSVLPGQKSTEAVGELSSKAKDIIEGVKEGGEREVKRFWRRGGEIIGSPVRIMRSLASLLHLLGFFVAYGIWVWVTFVSSYVMAGSLPRNQFAMLQSKIQPVYFKAMAGCVGLSLLAYLPNRVGKGMFGGLDLALSFAMILVNLFYLEPRTSKVANERMKKEKEEGTGKGHVTTEHKATSKEKREVAATAAKPWSVRTRELMMSRLNSNSSLLNVVTLMPLTWHLVQLALNLQAAG